MQHEQPFTWHIIAFADSLKLLNYKSGQPPASRRSEVHKVNSTGIPFLISHPHISNSKKSESVAELFHILLLLLFILISLLKSMWFSAQSTDIQEEAPAHCVQQQCCANKSKFIHRVCLTLIIWRIPQLSMAVWYSALQGRERRGEKRETISQFTSSEAKCISQVIIEPRRRRSEVTQCNCKIA